MRRVVTPDGRSRAFVNDEPASVGLLRELGDALVELPSLFHVGHRGVQRALGNTDRLGADAEPGVVQRLKCGFETGARLPDHAIGRNPATVEMDLAGR